MSTNTPQWKLYRLAPRSIEILELHKDKEPAIAVFEETLPPAASRVIELSAELRTYGSTRVVEQAEGKTGLSTLLQKTRAWGAIVDKLLGDASLRPLCARPDVPEDVIHDAVDLIGVVERRVSEGMPEPSFFAAMKADLEPAIEAARTESRQAATANTAYQELQAELRKACKAFQVELVAFRRTLAAFLGRSHRDYQRLRASRISRDDEADAIDDGDDFEAEDEVEGGGAVPAVEAAE
jgi:hypothetical protein